ncbi:MAG: hypothetical protein QF903_06555 [Planctomycetota bacterium]|jgi:hypothetical protein|nr:hypothetical protein [Planctomycetota bacterium]MDP6989122.1 hypothetical protein [Planctomycetota bacterium]
MQIHDRGIVVAIALCTLATAARGAAFQLDHAAAAQELLARDGITIEDGGPIDPLAYVRSRSVTANIGAFEVSISKAALAERRAARDLRDSCVSLVEVQEHWLEWTGSAAGAEAEAADLRALRTWVSKWNLGALRSVGERGNGRETELPGLNEEIESTLARLRTRSLEAGRRPVRLVLVPSREEFVGLCCLAGQARPSLRPALWVEGIEKWTWFFVDDVRFVSLEYATIDATPTDYSRGTRIDSRNPSGLRQHVSQLAVNEMLRARYGEGASAAFVSGIAMNLVIDIFGEVDTRIDGDLRGRMTRAREMFIPGGNPAGGVLPKISADTRWRTHRGKYHFVRILRQAQKAGGNRRRGVDKVRTFLLQNDNGRLEYALRAPVLGPTAVPTVTPPSWAESDRLEFIRAYKSGFLFWLRENGGADDDDARAAFGRLLAALERSRGTASLEETLERVYGIPLSEPELGEDCLEGRFLRWLSKQRG